MSTATRVDQTIFVGDPKRPGNCVSACVASYLGLSLERVPHFLEHGSEVGTPVEDRTAWWWVMIGFMAAHGLWPGDLDDVAHADEGELVFVAGPSPRGIAHQVLYRDGNLWHDPHPSRAGVLAITEVLAWRPVAHDHAPTSDPAPVAP